MRGPVFFHMWTVLILGTLTGVVRAQVSTTKVMRGNNRRDDSNRLTTDLYRKEENITVTPQGGVIHSPRYPNAYPRNLLLSWKLLSPPGSRIHLEFDGQFGLEEAENGMCRYDFVEVEDQSETSTIIWGRWCGQKAPPSLNSKTNKLKVTFKSDDYFVARPGFKIYYSPLYESPLPASNTNWEAVTVPMLDSGGGKVSAAVTEQAPFSLDDLDRTIAAFDTVEQLLRSLNPNTWRQDLDSIYTQTHIHYRSRAYHLAGRHNKVDLNRLHNDVKWYSCTPRNYSVNLREELKTTNAVFFPRCLLVKRCGGNCGCGTTNWNNGCTCQASKTTLKLHEVLKYAPDPIRYQRHQSPKVRWVIDEIFLSHHEQCECACPSQPPR
ncbi:platelet-derived growth factor D isoform X1 [Astatotilapia calliptera]|uniref:platelet-derived growth factor D isoform X1 n=1 Tax=Astatotilapia calliptera TaxID=8154 RepID=UPI000E42B7D5|nr:platelet-derived growth factor D isoform X1 [Astatotilapia calliptera]XP_026048773.1 platelet-derived growth factor D isoform X1 [Astatotilapia calliptera]